MDRRAPAPHEAQLRAASGGSLDRSLSSQLGVTFDLLDAAQIRSLRCRLCGFLSSFPNNGINGARWDFSQFWELFFTPTLICREILGLHDVSVLGFITTICVRTPRHSK